MQAKNASRSACAAISLALIICGCFVGSLRLNAQAPPEPPPLNLNAPGLTLDSVIRYLRLYANPADTAEGGGRMQLNEFARTWQGRVTQNDSLGTNMFMRYANATRLAVQARLSSAICGSAGGYTGNWSCLGPDSLPSHNLGLLRDVWASPTDTNFLLATSYGGLFKSTDAGRNWQCISDNAPVSLGMISLNNIAVNPKDEDVIYCGCFTYQNQTYKLEGSWFGFGPGLLATTDGGASWHIEVLPFHTPPDWTDSLALPRKVFFAPGGGRMYAFRDSVIFCKEAGGSWQAIIPAALANTCFWQDLEFVPTGLRTLDSSHFFVASEYNTHIFECYYNPATHQHSVSEIPLPYAPGTGLLTIDLSIPTGSLMYAMFWRADNGVDLWKYDLAAQSWSLIKANLPVNKLGTPVFNMEASKSNPAVVYFGFERAYMSADTGHNLVQIGAYSGTPTHGDIRLLHIQSDSTTPNGVQDRVYFATDGGIALKPKGVNPMLNGTGTLKNINGKGLATGRFMGVGTSEQGGLVLASQGDNGYDAYEPRQNPKWICMPGYDGEEAEFRRTEPVAIAGGSGGGYTAWLDEVSSSGFTGRALDQVYWVADVSDTMLHEKHSGLIPMWSDKQGGMYTGFTHMWRVLPNSSTFVRVSGLNIPLLGRPYDIHLPEYTKPGTQYNPPIKCMSFSQYLDSLTGYVVYEDGALYYRNYYAGANLFAKKSTTGFTATYPPTDIVCDPRHPEKVWLSCGGVSWYDSARYRVLYSPDAAGHWFDISKGLPTHIPVTHIVAQEGTPFIYCATDVGIYRLDMSTFAISDTNDILSAYQTVSWACFNQALPASTTSRWSMSPTWRLTTARVSSTPPPMAGPSGAATCWWKRRATTRSSAIWCRSKPKSSRPTPPGSPTRRFTPASASSPASRSRFKTPAARRPSSTCRRTAPSWWSRARSSSWMGPESPTTAVLSGKASS